MKVMLQEERLRPWPISRQGVSGAAGHVLPRLSPCVDIVISLLPAVPARLSGCGPSERVDRKGSPWLFFVEAALVEDSPSDQVPVRRLAL